MNQNSRKNELTIPSWLFVINFIPVIGVAFGVLLIILSLLTSKKIKTILWGIFGIIFTPIFWLFSVIIFENTKFSEESDYVFTKRNLNLVKKELVTYQAKNKTLPDSITQLSSQNKFYNDSDSFSQSMLPWKESEWERLYYKKLSDTNYILKSKGKDRLLNTNDDISPD